MIEPVYTYHMVKEWVLNLKILARIRIGMGLFAFISFISTYLFWESDSVATDWDWFYRFLFPVATVTALWGAIRPRIGRLFWYLFPLLIGSVVRIVDFWQNYFVGQPPPLVVQQFLLGTVGWAGIATSIYMIDVLDGRLYDALTQRKSDDEQRVE